MVHVHCDDKFLYLRVSKATLIFEVQGQHYQMRKQDMNVPYFCWCFLMSQIKAQHCKMPRGHQLYYLWKLKLNQNVCQHETD